MEIQVKRFEYSSNYTISKLYVDGEYLCYVLEDTVREIEGVAVSKWKIPSKTAIPKGTYEVTLTYSPHFQKMMPLLNGVEGYEGVRIHTGNTATDTEGCLIVGSIWIGGWSVGGSRAAMGVLMPMIEDAVKKSHPISLKIGDSATDFT